jgi:hypothetical protein
MAKKRRVTDDQARLLAISFINRVMMAELLTGPGTSSTPRDWMAAYFKNNLPEKWWDGETSDQSWELTWLETRVQFQKLMNCLLDEAKRVSKENQGFRV